MLLGTPAGVWDSLAHVAGPLVPAFRHRILALKARKLGRMLAAQTADQFYQLAASTWHEAPLPGGAVGALVLEPARWPAELDFAERMMAVDTATYLPDDILVKVDRASMAVSLEARVPLLDPDLYRFAWRLPLAMRVRDGSGKWILRRVLDRYVPRALFERPKMGFGIPLDDWLRGPLRPWAEELLAESALSGSGEVDPRAVRSLWAAQLAGANEATALWPVLMLQAWLGHGRG
jgi:asparagine synthase (glutamine-hydrolysing)